MARRTVASYCGPAAIASALGITREAAATKLLAHEPQSRGLFHWPSLADVVGCVGLCTFRATRPTLAKWLREDGRDAILFVARHFVHVQGGQVVEDNGYPARRGRVRAVILLGNVVGAPGGARNPEPSSLERPTTTKEDIMAKKTAAQKAKAAKAAKAKRNLAAKPKGPAKPVMTDAQKAASAAKREKEAAAHKAAQATTRLARRGARDAIHTAALKRFWALVKDGEQFRFGEVGIKIGATAAIAALAGDAELSPADWRNVGLRCNRHYENQGAVETVPGTAPRWFRAVAGASPDTKPRVRVAKAKKAATPKAKAAAKAKAAPSAAGAKAKAQKAKAARDAAKAKAAD